MSLPPERIVLKRRRDDDAVDRLYLRETRDKRVRFDFHWQKLGGKDIQTTDTAPFELSKCSEGRRTNGSDIDPYVAHVPIIRSTLSDTEDEKHDKEQSGLFSKLNGISQMAQPTTKPYVHSRVQRPQPSAEARQFRLIKDSFISPSHVSAGHGVHKCRNKGRVGVAMFTERSLIDAHRLLAAAQSSKVEAAVEPRSEDLMMLESKPVVETKTYKRPNTAAEEVKWRARTWNKPSEIDRNSNPVNGILQPSTDEYSPYAEHSLELAMQLQALALRETEGNTDHISAIDQKPQLKFQPRPPKPRLQKNDTKQSADVTQDEDDFVYDTYVRFKGSVLADCVDSDLGSDKPLQAAQLEKVGLLVIEQEDEEAWDEYAEHTDSEKEWDTDYEDENGLSILPVNGLTWLEDGRLTAVAEDYYGNDYPEDELESDDEYNRDAYKYLKNASDDEECDEDLDSESEGEGEKPLPKPVLHTTRRRISSHGIDEL